MTSVHATLADALEPHAVSLDLLRQRHGVLLTVADKMLGVVPNAGRYLEIWPVGFRTYNLLAPTFLYMPALMLSAGKEKRLVGLVMYAASRAAQCAYCSAHSCSFALRRGADAASVAHALDASSADRRFTPADRAALDVAEALGRLPATLTDVQREAFSRSFSESQGAQLVLAIGLMGFLNKFMDGLGVPLEDVPFNEAVRVIAASGWSPGKHRAQQTDPPAHQPLSSGDSIGRKLSLFPLMPALIARERGWTAGVPGRWPEVGTYLSECVGYDFPVLSRLQRSRPIRALATAVRDNADASVSELGLQTKFLAGIAYATVAEDEQLLRAMNVLADGAGATRAHRLGSSQGLGDPARAAQQLALAGSSSPAQIAPDIIDRAEQALSPAAIVELMVWLSLLQAVHRLNVFYAAEP